MLKITQRDKRAIRIVILLSVVILGYVAVDAWLTDWNSINTALDAYNLRLDELGSGDSPATFDTDMLVAVPTMEMPKAEKVQNALFRDEVTSRFQKAGIRPKSLQYIGGGDTKRISGFKVLRLQCRASCRIDQIFDLMASLDTNPYLLGVEELRIKPDTKNRSNAELVLTLSTFAR